MTQIPNAGDRFSRLVQRFDQDYLARRLRLQVEYVSRFFGPGLGGIHLENLDFLHPALDWGFRLVGLRRRAIHNATTPRVNHTTFRLANLPSAFAGLRILHLSDLHLDCNDPGMERLLANLTRTVAGQSFDLAVITGDFRFKSVGPYQNTEALLASLLPHLKCRFGVYAVLGNHDFIEQVPALEALGVTVLVNEATQLEADHQSLWLVGLDDPHFYGTFDLVRATAQVPAHACQIWLVHSPELVKPAQDHGADLYLTGHTHGGQLCLPGGIPLYLNVRCAWRLIKGRWRLGALQGYTSSGVGASLWPGRFHCPPEVAIHRLIPG